MPEASEVRNPPFLLEAKPTAREAHTVVDLSMC